jgi:uncharacterized FlaG/YvyC family protein
VKKVLFIFLVCASGLFANPNDFFGVLQQIVDAASEKQQASGVEQKSSSNSRSLAEEKAFQAKQKQREDAQKQAYRKKFEEVIIPRANNLKAFNNAFYEKYLVKHSDTPEMIDNKFKNRDRLYPALIKDLEASNTEYKILTEARDKMCPNIGEYCNFEINKIDGRNIPEDYIYNINGTWDDKEDYEQYLREAYNSYEARQQRIKEAQQREAENAKKLLEDEARKKAIAAERKRVEPACKKWRAEARKRVNSLGVGDIVYAVTYGSGSEYVIEAVNANTFTVHSNLPAYYQTPRRYYLEKSSCIPASMKRTAPSPYCYQ